MRNTVSNVVLSRQDIIPGEAFFSEKSETFATNKHVFNRYSRFQQRTVSFQNISVKNETKRGSSNPESGSAELKQDQLRIRIEKKLNIALPRSV